MFRIQYAQQSLIVFYCRVMRCHCTGNPTKLHMASVTTLTFNLIWTFTIYVIVYGQQSTVQALNAFIYPFILIQFIYGQTCSITVSFVKAPMICILVNFALYIGHLWPLRLEKMMVNIVNMTVIWESIKSELLFSAITFFICRIKKRTTWAIIDKYSDLSAYMLSLCLVHN